MDRGTDCRGPADTGDSDVWKTRPCDGYLHPNTGRSVVVDDATGEVFHVGGDGFVYDVARDTYEILDQAYDRNLETWAFEPGTVVECQRQTRDGRKVLIATKAVDPVR